MKTYHVQVHIDVLMYLHVKFYMRLIIELPVVMFSFLFSRHEKALEGITVCGEIRGRDRFIPVIMGLGMRDNQPMQVACIQLVNAIVSTPDDLDFRLHLRNEFMRTGLIDLIGVSYGSFLCKRNLILFFLKENPK